MKASIRSNQTLVKQFREERELDIYFLVDASSSMVFGSTDKLKNEYAAEFVASLAHFILRVGDNVGLVMFNDNVVHNLPAANGSNQFYMLLRGLVDPSLYGGGYNLEEAIRFIIRSVQKKGLLIIVSDFIGLRAGWEKILRLATGKFDVIGVMVRDPRDRELPRGVGQVMISDPYTGKTMLVNPDEVGPAYENYVKRYEAMVEAGFAASKADLIKLATDKSFIKPVINYFRRRELIFSS
ncbi:MAG: hypothetical protein DRO99_00555 [Candidatus Aenigmatarchaeota archaeon]|nr:MAG: hypothetical protein DRO99_00555 [Candidatus Aenigmarchaeota archaeon]